MFVRLRKKEIEAMNINLQQLEGSEKQVAWASEIRAQTAGEWGKVGQSLKAMDEAARARAIEWLNCGQRLQSSFWIEKRNGGCGSVVVLMYAALGKGRGEYAKTHVEEYWK